MYFHQRLLRIEYYRRCILVSPIDGVGSHIQVDFYRTGIDTIQIITDRQVKIVMKDAEHLGVH